ncbi:uncharacterized protein LOC128272396 [Anopheles cruzii]|uniref:uncharacterized protein LOC128272396 n=1 Tax=Anopheles cruzii TaxID=68878 RepID=UPI0022EC27DC|nr:uncharacterized protein LOC128272396 [Anopheles cruzii]
MNREVKLIEYIETFNASYVEELTVSDDAAVKYEILPEPTSTNASDCACNALLSPMEELEDKVSAQEQRVAQLEALEPKVYAQQELEKRIAWLEEQLSSQQAMFSTPPVAMHVQVTTVPAPSDPQLPAPSDPQLAASNSDELPQLPVRCLEQLMNLEAASPQCFPHVLNYMLAKRKRGPKLKGDKVLKKLVDFYFERQFLNTCVWKKQRPKRPIVLSKYTNTLRVLYNVTQHYDDTYEYNEFERKMSLYVKHSQFRSKTEPRRCV